MELQNKTQTIVFLIDTNLATCDEKNHLSEVILTVIRLLSWYSRCTGACRQAHETLRDSKSTTPVGRTSCVHMKWGFKLFNTSKMIPRSRSRISSLKSFKLAHVENFEETLKEAFSTEKENGVSKPKTYALCPAELLSAALTESLYDFKWTEHDVLDSPVNRRRSGSKENTNINTFSKSVFVFTKAPCSKKSLRHFANKMVLDSDVLIDSFLSPALLNEYQQKMKISLNCVDFSSHSCTLWNSFNIQDESSAESLSILRDTFRRLGGCFISKHVILSCGPVTNNDTDLSRVPLDPLQMFSIFPHESFLPRLKDHRQPQCGIKIPAKLSSKSLQDIPVNLFPIAMKQNAWSQASPIINSASNSISTSSIRTAGRNEQSKSCSQLPQHYSDLHFTLRGCVSMAAAGDLLATNMSASFMLTCEDSGFVNSLLQQMAGYGNIGILSMTQGGRPSLTMAVLQAYSESIGFISLLNLNAAQSVEKCLMQQQCTTSLPSDTRKDCAMELDDDQPCSLSFMEKLHRDVQKLKSSVAAGPPAVKRLEQSCIFQPHCMNSWHVAGSTGQMSSLVSKINERISNVAFKSDKDFMKQLQKHYLQERHPPHIIKCAQPAINTPVCVPGLVTNRGSGGSESGSTSSLGGLTNLGSLTLSRGRLMVSRARNANFVATEDESESLLSRSRSPKRKRSSSSGFVDLDLKTENDLKSYLQKQYDQVLKAGVAMEVSAQTMVIATSRFMSKIQTSDPQKATVNFIKECLELGFSKMKVKQGQQTSEGNQVNIVAEYKLQIILLIEMESQLKDADAVNHEVLNETVSMLRAISFLTSASIMTSFLLDIVTSYSQALPKLLVDIYDELMLPLPAALAKFASPVTPSSVSRTPLSHHIKDASLLSAPGSSTPLSHLSDQSSQQAKRFKFKQHPSLTDFRQKKQILIKPKPKVETKKAETDKTNNRSSRTKRVVDYDYAKKNLFSTDQRSKTRSAQKSRRSASKSSRTLVLGTPVHKQTSQRHLMQQERRRRRENIQPEIQVVAETPVKDEYDGDNDEGNEDSLLNRPARYIVREAFYSSKAQPSRNLVKSFEQAGKNDFGRIGFQDYMIHKSQGTLSSALRGESPILSPRSRMIRTLLSSPSPTPKSKQKYKHAVKLSQRCSPRKSAKKILFGDSEKKTDAAGTKPADTGYAHLIYDGENANDFSSGGACPQPDGGAKKGAKQFPFLGAI